MRSELFKGINEMGDLECYLVVTDKGIMMYGNSVEARAMLSQLVNQLQKHGIPEHELKEAFEIGIMSNKDRDKLLKQEIKNLLNGLFEPRK